MKDNKLVQCFKYSFLLVVVVRLLIQSSEIYRKTSCSFTALITSLVVRNTLMGKSGKEDCGKVRFPVTNIPLIVGTRRWLEALTFCNGYLGCGSITQRENSSWSRFTQNFTISNLWYIHTCNKSSCDLHVHIHLRLRSRLRGWTQISLWSEWEW